MATHKILLAAKADKELGKLPTDVQERIDEVIDGLTDDPNPPGCRKLRGRDGYRVRIGDYRVLYAVNDEEKVVFVFRSGIESKFTGEKRRR